MNHTSGVPSVNRPSVACDGNGNFVVVWDSFGSDGSDYGVYFRRYNSAGSPLPFSGYPLAARRVNETTEETQDSPNIAMRPDGSFIIVWRSLNQASPTSGNDVYFRRFDQDANALDTQEVLVNTSFTAGSQEFADVAVSANGQFIVVWQSEAQDGSGSGVFARRYASTGLPTGSFIQVSAGADGNQQRPGVAMDANGGFAVVWESDAPGGGGEGFDVYVRHFASDDSPIPGSETRVNSFVTGFQGSPRISMADDGRHAVTWVSEGGDGAGFGVAVQIVCL